MITRKNGYNKISAKLFALVYLCLFLSTFTGLISEYGVEQVKAFGISVLILVISCFLIHGLLMLIKRLNQGKKISDVVFYFALTLCTLIFVVLRIFVFGGVISFSDDLGEIAMRAMIDGTGKVYVDFSNLDGLFSTVLSCFFKIFGNTYFALYFAQFILMSISYVLVLRATYKLAGKLSTIFVALGMALSVVCINSMAYGNTLNLFLLLVGISLNLLEIFINEIEVRNYSIKSIAIIGVAMGVLYVNCDWLLAFLLIPIIVTVIEREDEIPDVLKINGVYILFAGLTLLVITILSGIISGVGIINCFTNVFKNRFVVSFGLDFIETDIIWHLALILALFYVINEYIKKNDKIYIMTYIIIISGIQYITLGYNNEAMYILLMLTLMCMTGGGISFAFVYEERGNDMNNNIDLELEEERRAFFENLEPEVVNDNANIIGEWEEISVIDKEDSAAKFIDEFKFEELSADNDDNNKEFEPIITEPDFNNNEIDTDVHENVENMDAEVTNENLDDNLKREEEVDLEALAKAALEEMGMQDSFEFEYSNDEVIVGNEPDFVEDIDASNEIEPEYVDEHLDVIEDKPEYVWDESTGEFVLNKNGTEIDAQESIPNSSETFFDDDNGNLPVEEKSEELVEDSFKKEIDYNDSEVTEDIFKEATEKEIEDTVEEKVVYSNEIASENVADDSEGKIIEELNFEDEKPVEYIENPLPLPKKHEHREMDYGRIIPASLMHYDYAVPVDKDHYDY